MTLLPTKKSPPPPSSSSSSEEDDDLFDQEEIEEQIDRIDNEIAKQERLLLQQKSKLSNDLNPSKKVVIKIPRICNPALNLEIKEPGTEQREMKHDGRPPKNTKELIDKIYSENRVLVSKLNVQHLENKTNFYNLVNGGSIQKPNYDAHLFEKLEIVNPNLRPAIVAFVKGRVMGTNYEQKKLGTRFRILEQEWRVKVEKMESKEEKEIVPEIPEIPKEENLIIETVVQPEGRSTRRGGIRSDVVRSEAEWQNALSLLGISNSNLDTVNIAKPNPYKASGLAKEIPLLSKYEIESLQKFHNNNDLVLDAAADLESFNQKQTLLWTEHDRNLFRQKLALHGKDFRKISEYLEGKSTQDCVSYYYREKINGRFKSMIKRASGRGRKRIDNEEIGQGCGFSTFYLQSDEEFVQEGAADDSSSIDSDRHNGQESEEHEVDLLDSATTIDLPDWTFEEKQRALRGFELFGRDFESVAAIVTTKTATQCKLFFNHQRRQAREPLISTEKKKKKRARKRTTEETNITNPEAIKKSSSITPKEATDDNSTNKRTISYWTVNERREFLVELEKHGRDWEKISAAIPTKSGIQVRNFFHNSRKKMNLDAILEQRG